MEVPLILPYEPGMVEKMDTPGAVRSISGPLQEKYARLSLESSAPTAMTSSNAAG